MYRGSYKVIPFNYILVMERCRRSLYRRPLAEPRALAYASRTVYVSYMLYITLLRP